MKSILKVSIRQIKAARALLGWSQEHLAEKAGISVPTIKRLEAADGLLGGRADTGIKLRDALERAGIDFTNGNHPGVRLRRPAGLGATALEPSAAPPPLRATCASAPELARRLPARGQAAIERSGTTSAPIEPPDPMILSRSLWPSRKPSPFTTA